MSRRNEKVSKNGSKDHNKSMSFVGVKKTKEESNLGNENLSTVQKNKLKGIEGNETPRHKEVNQLDKPKGNGIKNKTDDDKLLKELEKSRNVISDLKDQLIYSNKERDF